LRSGPTTTPSVLSTQNKGLHALLRELSDDEEDMVATSRSCMWTTPFAWSHRAPLHSPFRMFHALVLRASRCQGIRQLKCAQGFCVVFSSLASNTGKHCTSFIASYFLSIFTQGFAYLDNIYLHCEGSHFFLWMETFTLQDSPCLLYSFA
jgi:hypothetical protein